MGIKGRYCLALIYGAILAFFAVDFSFAKPQGGVVTYGSVTINQNPGNNINTLITQTSGKGIIDWQSFSIAEYERVHFAQPNAAAITLNRVLGGDVSNIFGKLSATGQIFILNPSGILFGPNAVVDVAGLIATTANISNADFLSDKYFFVQGPNNNAKVINQGYIKVADSGLVALIAPGVENSGIIEANLGKVVLASTSATSTFVIDFYGDELINFTVPTDTNENTDTPVIQSGKIIAHGGKVLLTVNSAKNIVDSAINMSGIIEADTVSRQGGSVVLQGGSKGVVSVTGKISARGTEAGESGGTVKITGEKVGLFSPTMIDVSGEAGGGKVLVGADYQNGTVVPASSMVYVNEGATILANALGLGNGGNVIIWSNDSTWFYGTVSAKGGPEGGSGGSLETSGNWLDVNYSIVDLTAPNGEVGTWLIDPFDVYIVGGSPPPPPENGTWNGGNWTPNVSNSILYASSISSNLSSANVSINTGSSGSQAGNITINSGGDINYTNTTARTLTLNAAGTITVGAQLGGNNLSVNLNTSGNTIFPIGLSTPLQSLTTDAGGSTIINANMITSGSQTYNDAVLLQNDTNFTGSSVSFNNTVDSYDNITARNLTLNISGSTLFNGAVGATNKLSNLNTSTSGNTILSGGTIITQGSQIYNDAVLLQADTLLSSGAGNNINFSNTLNGNGYNLTLNAFGSIFLPNVVNLVHNLTAVVLGGAIYISSGGGSITTTGSQTYNGPLVVSTNNAIFTSTGSGNIFFDSYISGSFNLTVNTSGSTVFSPFSLSSGALLNLTTDAGGNTILDGSGVYTAGSQTYNDAVLLRGDITFISGGNISFNNTVDSYNNTARSLTINTSASTSFNGAVGATNSLLNLVTNSSGTTTIRGGSVKTTLAQTYNNPLYLGADTLLTSTGVGDISFLSTLNNIGGPYNLTINTSGNTILPNVITLLKNLTTDVGGNTIVGISGIITTSGSQTYNDAVFLQNDTTLTGSNITFNGSVDSINNYSLRNLTINVPGNTSFNGAVGTTYRLSNLNTSTSGNTILNGGSVTTNQTQNYNNPVSLGNDTVLSSTNGGDIHFFSALNNSSYNLTINTSGNTFLPNVINLLGSLTTDAGGNTIIGTGGSVTTTGSQTYNDTVFLQNNTTFTSIGSGDIKFGSGVSNNSGGPYNLTVNTAGNTIFSGILSSLQNLTTNVGGNTIIGGSITTLGSQTYNDAVFLQNNTALTGSNITFNGTVDSNTTASNLTVSASFSTSFNGAVGAANPLLNLITSATGITNINGGSITTTQAQTYNNPLSLGNDTVLSSTSGGNINFSSTLSGSGYSLTINTAGNTVLIGSSLSALQNLTTNVGGSTIISGNVTTSGSQTYNDAVLLQSNAIFTSIGSGNISFNTVSSSGNFNLTVNTAGNTIFSGILSSLQNLITNIGGNTIIGGGNVNTTGSQTYNDAVRLQNDTLLTAGVGSNITFNATVDSNTTASNLTVNASGSTSFNGAVGAISPLRALIIGAGGFIFVNGGNIITQQFQQYSNPVFLGNNTVLTSTNGDFIAFSGGLSGVSYNLTINTIGNTILPFGFNSPLGSLTTDAGGSTVLGGDITTSGSQTYNDAVLLQTNINLTSVGSGNISFGNTVSGSIPLYILIVNTAANTIFSGAVSSLQNLITNIGGNTIIGGGSVNTTGSQTYNDAVLLQNDTTLTGSNITFNGTVDSNTTLFKNLTINVNTPGITTFNGAVGATNQLKNLLVTNTSGTTNISGGSVKTNQTQTYNGPVLLQNNTIFTSTGSGDIKFGNTLSGGFFNLTVNTIGNTIFSGILSSLQNLITDIGGNTIIGGNITTSGLQTYNDAVRLQNDTLLTAGVGSNITFNGTVDSINNTSLRNLTINAPGITSFNGAVGATYRLSNLNTSANGTTNINGGSIKTNQTQNYNNPVSLGNDTVLSSTNGGDIHFFSALNNSSYNLTINTSGNTFLPNVINLLGSLTTDAGGNTIIGSGGSITTSGSQTYNDAVLLQSDTNLVGSSVLFNNTVDSYNTTARSLTVNMTGGVTFANTVGGTNQLLNLTTNANNATIGGNVTTSGSQTYNNTVFLQNNATFTSTGSGNISFVNNVSSSGGPYNLTVNTAGNTIFSGILSSLQNLITDVGGNTIIGSGNVSTLGSQTYNDAVLLQAHTVFTSTGSGNIAFANTVNSFDGTPFNLTVNTAGDISFLGALGTINAVLDLVTNGGTTIIGHTINTLGNQAYNNPVLITGNALLNAGGNIFFGNTINGAGIPGNLVITTLGNLTFLGTIGVINPLASLSITASNIPISSTVNTIGAQIYNGPLALNANTSLSGGSITFNNAITGSFGLILNTGSGDILFNGPVGSFNAPLSGLQILNANNVNAFGQIFTNSFTQNAGSGTTNFAVLLFSGTGGVGSYVPGTGNGPILIITNNVTGIIDTGSLDLLTQAANLTGYLNGQAAPQGITNIVLLNTIGPGTHFWGGVDMFFSPIPPVPPIPPAPPVPPVPSVITNKFISDVARILEGATRLWRQNITCVNHGSEVLYFKKDGSLDRLYFTGPVTICK